MERKPESLTKRETQENKINNIAKIFNEIGKLSKGKIKVFDLKTSMNNEITRKIWGSHNRIVGKVTKNL
jgi:hypothetical protein